MMLANDIRTRFLKFFEKRGHTIIPSASLVTPDEKGVTNSTLFNTAGMQPLVPYLLGQPYLINGQEQKRLVDTQKCLRTVDLDEVGDQTHATFFEMLGNWSLGDYFKKDAIKWSYEFLTSKEEGLGLDPNRLYVTVFAGDANAPRDDEAADLWRGVFQGNKVAIGGATLQGEAGRIFYLPAAKNWWEAGENGPCGPDTEMYYDVKNRFGGRTITKEEFIDADDRRDLVEIWNDVFMQYEKSPRTILIDAKYCLLNEDLSLNEEMAKVLDESKRKVIVVTNLPEDAVKPIVAGHNFDIFTLNKNPDKTSPEFFQRLLEKYQGKPEDYIYCDHLADNLKSAEKLGIVTALYRDLAQFKIFIDNNRTKITKLTKPSVDTGAGLERLAMVMQDVDNIYDTDLLKPVMEKIKELAGNLDLKSARIVADHIRASIFLIADGVMPGNTGRGYVLRRLLRRAQYYYNALGMTGRSLIHLIDNIVDVYKNTEYQLGEKNSQIVKIIAEEEVTFIAHLQFGKKYIDNILKSEKQISAEDAFLLYSTYGYPFELILDVARQYGKEVDAKGFLERKIRHQELSRMGAEQKFKGGLGDANDPMVVRYHTATHLLHQALFDVLGAGVMQKGSNITPERLRFDFAHPAKMTEAEKQQVEAMVNEKIAAKLPVKQVTLPKDEAIKTGAKHFFGEKYPDQVSVYFVGPDLGQAYSKEFCGGPHVSNTSELAGPDGQWRFKILKEEAVAAGIRRIKAVLTK